MLHKTKGKQLINDKSDELLPFHYPNKKSTNNQINRINQKAFYYIYNEYHKKYMKSKNNKIRIPKGNSFKNENKSFNDINPPFHKKFNFVPRRKKNDNNEYSKSISIHKYNTINDIDFSIRSGQNNLEKSNDASFNRIDKIEKENTFKRSPSNYNLYIPKLNYPNKLVKKDNNIGRKSNEDKDKSFIFKRNPKNRILSSKSCCSNDKNSKFNIRANNKENKLENKNYFENSKEIIYNIKMTKIDKFVKLLNNNGKKIHHVSFDKNKDINNEVNELKIVKNNLIKEYNNKRTISNINLKRDKIKKEYLNNISYNKNFISSQTQISQKEEKNKIEMNKSNDLEIKYAHKNNSKINLYDKEKNKNIHKMIEYIYNYEKFQDKKNNKNNRNFKKLNNIKNKRISNTFSKEKIRNDLNNEKLNEYIQIKQIHINKDNKFKENNKNKIKNTRIPYDLKYYQTIISGRKINKYNIKKEENKIQTDEINYNKINSINNYKYDRLDKKGKNFMKKEENNDNSNEIKSSNIEQETKNNLFNTTYTTIINNNPDIIGVRKYLNDYYKNKYKNNLTKNNSFNYARDKAQSFIENNYNDSLKNNILEKSINEDKNDKIVNNNNNNYNNLSSNVNINININQNDISNKKININLNASETSIVNQEENKKENSFHLLTPSFDKDLNNKIIEQKNNKQEKNQKNTFENNSIKENNNCKIMSNIPFNPDNNKKFKIIQNNDYTFKNKNQDYRNKLIKKNQFRCEHSIIENNKNSYFDENNSNKQSIYNINSQKRKEDLFQLLNFSQKLNSKEKL